MDSNQFQSGLISVKSVLTIALFDHSPVSRKYYSAEVANHLVATRIVQYNYLKRAKIKGRPSANMNEKNSTRCNCQASTIHNDLDVHSHCQLPGIYPANVRPKQLANYKRTNTSVISSYLDLLSFSSTQPFQNQQHFHSAAVKNMNHSSLAFLEIPC